MSQQKTKQVVPKSCQDTLSRYLKRLRTIEIQIHNLWLHKITQARYWGATETEITNLQIDYSNSLNSIQKDIKATEQKLLDKINCSGCANSAPFRNKQG